MARGQITNVGSGAGDIFSQAPTIVRVKQSWGDEWVLVPYLHAVEGYMAVAPTVPRMTLKYRYGMVDREGQASFAEAHPLNLDNWYVEVAAVFPASTTGETELRLWWGVIGTPSFDIYGSDVVNADGLQTFEAYGLEHLLDRKPIDGSYMVSPANLAVKVDWSPAFNVRYSAGGRVIGNMDSVWLAFGGGDAAVAWSIVDILDYLESHFFPSSPTFELEIPANVSMLLGAIEPVIRLEGMTIRGALNELVGRNRGLGWRIETDGVGVVRIRIFSLASEEVSVGDHTLPANDNIADVNLSDSIDMTSVSVSIVEQSRYDKIRVQGARMKTCCTLSYADATLDKGWTASEAGEYRNPGKASAELNDLARGQERFARVFQHFRVPPGWNWMAGGLVVNPISDEFGEFDTGTGGAYSNHFKGFLQHLPFKIGKDYSVSLENPTDRNPSNSEPVHRRPFVLIKIEDGGKYYYIERVYHPTWGFYSASFSMLDRELAFQVDCNPNHAMALNHWAGADDSALEPVAENSTDWHDMIVTVFLETDIRPYVEVDVWEETQSEFERKLTITIPEVECHYVVPDTVCDVSDEGALVRVAGGGFIRDDTERLRAVAAAAKAWYSVRRATLRMSFKGVQLPVEVGTLIRSAGDAEIESIGTVVTRVSWDFGTKERAGVTRVETGFAELDFLSI